MTALKMTADEALALAEGWAAGMTFDAKSDGPFTCLLALAEEVRRLRMELAHEEQRVADMMDAVNRVGHEIERLRADARRLDALEREAHEPGGLRLHAEAFTESRTVQRGLGLQHRSLREAVDQFMEASNAG